jgi:hypothetical protein
MDAKRSPVSLIHYEGPKRMEKESYSAVNLTRIRFEGVRFESCEFRHVQIDLCVFEKCQFVSCQFEEMCWQDVTWHQCEFHACRWQGVSFVRGEMRQSLLMHGECQAVSALEMRWLGVIVREVVWRQVNFSTSVWERCFLSWVKGPFDSFGPSRAECCRVEWGSDKPSESVDPGRSVGLQGTQWLDCLLSS